jgi:hypothetical protein
MRVEFDEEFGLPVEEVYPYFRSPADWPRLFGAFGQVKDRGEGWHSVPLRGFPFPLVTRITRDEPLNLVHWEFKGLWGGEGHVAFTPTSRGTVIRGFEQISPRPLLFLAPLAERLFLARRFERVWESGWRRLRRQAAARDAGAPPPSGEAS